MKTSPIRQAALWAAACLTLALAPGLVTLQVGCASNPSAYEHPAPAISSFTTGTLRGTTFTPTPVGSSYAIPQGSSAWLRANFATTAGGSAVVTPGDIPVSSNVPFQISGINATTTYTLTVTSGDSQKTAATATVNILYAPSNLTYSQETSTCYVDVQIAANTPTVAGSAPITYSVDPALPAGLRR